jgi:hypothetical protein
MGRQVAETRTPPGWLTDVGVVIALGIIVLVSSLAIGAPATTMARHGVSVEELQSAGTPAKAERAHDDLGDDGRRAAWWFLALELPFMAGYGLLLCAGCAFAARRLAAAGAERLARMACLAVPFGLLAAACDLIQNAGVAAVLLDHTAQPAPRIAQLFGYLTWALGISAGFVFAAGWLAAALRARRIAAR